jgi:hypothetical protein
MDSDDVGRYQPISNLSVLSKLFEPVIAKQLLDYLRTFNLLAVLQSGSWPGETAILLVVADILAAFDHAWRLCRPVPSGLVGGV